MFAIFNDFVFEAESEPDNDDVFNLSVDETEVDFTNFIENYDEEFSEQISKLDFGLDEETQSVVAAPAPEKLFVEIDPNKITNLDLKELYRKKRSLRYRTVVRPRLTFGKKVTVQRLCNFSVLRPREKGKFVKLNF